MTPVTMEQLHEWATARKLWLLVKSPFMEAADGWWVGFAPHGVTGWDGRPDYYGTGPLGVRWYGTGLTFQDAASVAVALWERFGTKSKLPPQGCNSRADLEATH